MSTHVFVDIIHDFTCALVIDGESIGVRHPGERHLDCPTLADVSPHLDAFYCGSCGYNGRISGEWYVERLVAELRSLREPS